MESSARSLSLLLLISVTILCVSGDREECTRALNGLAQASQACKVAYTKCEATNPQTDLLFSQYKCCQALNVESYKNCLTHSDTGCTLAEFNVVKDATCSAERVLFSSLFVLLVSVVVLVKTAVNY